MLNDENLDEVLEETPEEAEVNEDKDFENIEKKDSIKDEDMESEIHELKDKNNKLENELDALKERLLRISAEYENFRKRTEKEKKEIYTDACSDVLKHMLPVLDNLERAIASDGNAEDLKKGIEITIKQFEEAFKKLGIEELPSEGEFDPNYHNAIMHIEDENYGKNQIVEVFQRGFKRGDKVLRFSLVKVAN